MWLKQSTTVTVKIGPFVDDTDGKTAETGLTLTQADIRLSKNGGNMAQKNDANAATHDELGYYDCQINTTDTGTLGRLKLMVHESGALPVWHEYMIVSANTWDSFFAAENLDVNAVEISGDSAAADNCEAMFDGTGYIGGTIKLGTDVVKISGDATAADNLESYCDGTTPQPVNATQISGDATAADNAELAFDGTGYGFTGCTMPTTTDVTNQVTADMTAISGDAAAANNLESYCDGTTPQPVNTTEISGDSTAADNAELAFDGTGYGFTGCTMPTTTDVTNRVTANTDQIEGGDATDAINAACDASIETYNLDHLLAVACAGNVITGAVVDNSVMAILAAIGGDISDYADATDSQEALADAIAGITLTADLVWDEEMDVNAPGACNTAREYMNVLIAALAGATAGTGDWSARDLGDTKTRLQGTLTDAGARSSIDTLDGT